MPGVTVDDVLLVFPLSIIVLTVSKVGR